MRTHGSGGPVQFVLGSGDKGLSVPYSGSTAFESGFAAFDGLSVPFLVRECATKESTGGGGLDRVASSL